MKSMDLILFFPYLRKGKAGFTKYLVYRTDHLVVGNDGKVPRTVLIRTIINTSTYIIHCTVIIPIAFIFELALKLSHGPQKSIF